MDKDELIKKYCEALESGSAAIFVGAGLSVGAGFVDWKNLLAEVAKELGIKINSHTNLVDLAQYFVNTKGNRSELSSLIVKSFPSTKTPTDNHKIIASLPIRTFWTTNFDKLLELSLENENKVCDVKIQPSSLAISQPQSDAIIYKMHGDIDAPDETILTRDQFERYEQTHKAFLDSLSYDLTNKTFLFLGLSFDDPNLKYVLKYVRSLFGKNQRRHYYILKSVCRDETDTEEEFSYRQRLQDLFIEDLKNYGIDTLTIKGYNDISEILVSIKKRYLSHTVFISGAAAASEYGDYGEKEIKTFIRKLAASIIHEGFRIVNGYGLGFGNEVLAGAISKLNEEHKPIDGNIVIKPFPQELANPQETWRKYREEMISITGVSIFLLGNKMDKSSGEIINSNGMKGEYNISKGNGNLLIPVGATGFMAKELWDDLTNSNDFANCPFKVEMERLGDKSLSLDELHDVIIEILKKLRV